MAVLSFGAWLRTARRHHDLTQQTLAFQAGCSVVTIRKLEADERRPSRQIALRIAETLQIPAADHSSFVAFARGELDAASALLVATPATAADPLPHAPLGRRPTPLTPLIGRDADLAAAHRALLNPGERLLTLVGPAGIGKTRLALALGEATVRRFSDGVAFVALDTLNDPACVPEAIAAALGLADARAPMTLQRLIEALRERRMLLILDTFEHLLPAGRVLVDLLSALPQLQLLITSRAALKVRGERLFPVPPLCLAAPEPGNAVAPAVALFVDRAQATWPEFRLRPEHTGAITEICRALDGLPLAIELVAAWAAVISPEQIRTHLERHIQVPAGSGSDLPPRHQSLDAALAWSHALLAPATQRIFHGLSVFAGGCTIAAAMHTMQDHVESDILAALEALRQHSLITIAPGPDGQPRLHMLTTIRAYARQQAGPSMELAVGRRHAEYYRMYGEQLNARLRGPDQTHALRLFNADYANFTAALTWCFAEAGDAELGLQLVTALGWFWWLQSRYTEGMQWVERTLKALPKAPAERRGRVLGIGAHLAVGAHDRERRLALAHAGLALLPSDDAAARVPLLALLAEQTVGSASEASALRWGEAALAEARRSTDPWLTALALQSLSLGQNGAAAVASLETARTVAERSGDRWLRGVILFRLLIIRFEAGRLDLVDTELAELEHLADQCGDRRIMAATLLLSARSAGVRGDHSTATDRNMAALELAQAGGMPEIVAWSWVLEGIHQLELGATTAAATLLIDGMQTGAIVGAYEVLLRGAVALAGIDLAQGNHERSARWCALAAALEAQWSWPLTIREATHRGELARIEQHLGRERIAAVADDYRADREAIADAIRSLLAPQQPAGNPSSLAETRLA